MKALALLWRFAAGLVLIGFFVPLSSARADIPFARLAALTLDSPVVLRASVHRIQRIGDKNAVGLPPQHRRFLVTANVTALLTAPRAVPARISYLIDLPLDARGRTPNLKRADLLLFLSPGRGRDDHYGLTGIDAQMPWTATAEADIRRLIVESRQPALHGLRLTGINNAFHVPGSVPGEAESQIFLRAADGNPVSLVILSRPGQARSVSIALGDVIDEAATPIPPRSLLWYHIACTLPAELPAAAMETLDEAGRAAVADDYRFARTSIGACQTTP